MGLFDFIKDAGAKIGVVGREDEEITKLVKADLGDRITDLKVEFKNGVATLYGRCDSQATKEKAILIAGNVKGVAAVNDDNFSAPLSDEVAEFYTVVPGDSLSKIAKKYFGNANKYPEIFEANREVIKDPNLIYPGQKLRIPKLK